MIEKYLFLAYDKPLRYLTNENFGKPKLLLLHGVNLNADFFETIFPYLDKEFQLFAPDLRGHGKSFRYPGHYNLNDYVGDLKFFYHHVIKEPCFFLGMSLGGRIGLSLAIEYPLLIQKLVMVDVSPKINPEGIARLQNIQKILPESFSSRKELTAYYDTYYATVSPKYRETVLKYAWTVSEKEKWEISYDRNIWDINEQTAFQEQEYLYLGAPSVNLPVLVLRGENSDILSKEDALDFTSKLPNGTLIEIPESGHLLLVEKTELCVNSIKKFICSVE